MHRRAVLLVLVLLVAGCSAPTAPSTTGEPEATGDGTAEAGTGTTLAPDGTTDEPPEGPLAYRDATIPYDGPRVLSRVEALRSLDATGSILVTEFSVPETRSERDVPDQFAGIGPPGALALGLSTNATVEPQYPLGLTSAGPVVQLREDANAAGHPQELVFAHELAHALQYQHDFRAVDLATSGVLTTDRSFAVRGVVEGDAQLVALQYRNRYLPDASRPVVALGEVTRASWQRAFSSALYHYGREYYERAGTESRNAVLRDPPNSTRALLHPDVPRSTPALADAPESEQFDAVYADRVGELAVRLSLRANGVPESKAADAAFGWRNGRMTYYRSDDAAAVRWRTAWTNGTEAREFAAAWRGMLDARNATRQDGVLVVPATDTTPRFATAVERTGTRVLVVAARDPGTVRDLAQLSRSRSSSNSSSTASSSTDSSASRSASLGDRSPSTSSRSVSSSASTSSSSRL